MIFSGRKRRTTSSAYAWICLNVTTDEAEARERVLASAGRDALGKLGRVAAAEVARPGCSFDFCIGKRQRPPEDADGVRSRIVIIRY